MAVALEPFRSLLYQGLINGSWINGSIFAILAVVWFAFRPEYCGKGIKILAILEGKELPVSWFEYYLIVED